MKFKVPFTFGSLDKSKKRAAFFKRFVRVKEGTKLGQYLENSGQEITREEYISICYSGFAYSFVFAFILSSTLFFLIKSSRPTFYALVISLLFSMFIFFSRFIYPKINDSRKQKEIERNLIPALQDMLIQLNSGIPLFSILVNLSSSDYGSLSVEFQKIVKRINAGYSEIEVLDEAGEKNSSLFFRKSLWQISNGMRAGGDISIVVEQTVRSLNEEQLIQIQNYGNKLNPVIMFYMLISVIIPALSVTFLTIISSLLGLEAFLTHVLFIGLFFFVMIIQVSFLGLVKSIRPTLL